jgi:hypothetical protein
MPPGRLAAPAAASVAPTLCSIPALVQLQPTRYMPPRHHQVVLKRHRIGINLAKRQFVLQLHPAVSLQLAEHSARLAPPIAGLQSAKAVDTLALVNSIALARLAAAGR